MVTQVCRENTESRVDIAVHTVGQQLTGGSSILLHALFISLEVFSAAAALVYAPCLLAQLQPRSLTASLNLLHCAFHALLGQANSIPSLSSPPACNFGQAAHFSLWPCDCSTWRLNMVSFVDDLALLDNLKSIGIRSHSCSDPIEKIYYSAYKDDLICIHCGSANSLTTPTSSDTFYPYCVNCSSLDIIRHNGHNIIITAVLYMYIRT